ncbi:MAG: response regulator [Chloroflexi bacterium]|nr:response regulator [Chloroflexota bacterium]
MSNQAKILVVDDEPGIRVTLSGILEDEGFQVTDCDGGLKVLDRLANLDEDDWPDLIITDIKMPDVDGFQLLRFLKEGNSDRPVIFISGQATLDNAVEAVNQGAYAYHVKPLDIDALVNSVRNALRQHQLSAENRDLLKKLRKSNQTLRTYNDQLQAAAKELTASENKFRSLVEQAADAIFLLDPDDGALTEVNPRMEVLTGYSREELLGMSMPVLFREADRVGAAEVLNGAVSQGKAGVQHLSFQPRAGDPISIDLHCNLVEYQGRKLVLGVARDITGRRRAEEMVRRANLKLEQLQRFQAIQAAREDEQKKLAGELHDETMSDLAGLAVDISLLRRDIHPQAGVETELGRVREKIRDIDARLREIVEGIYPSVLTDLGLVSAVKSHLDRLTSRPVSNPNPIQITFSARGFENGRLSEVIEIALYRIVQQAVGNAIAHGEPSSLIVELAWERSEVLASVADDGKGFDPGAATSTHRNGHFGLETLKYRTEGLGGTLQIDSARGKGTTIRSRIPVNTPGSGAEMVQRGSYLVPARETD